MSKFAGMNNAEITSGQCAKILYMFALGSSSLILPTAVAAIAQQDAWLSMLIVGPINYLVLMIFLSLADRFPNMTIAQYAERLLGVWGGRVLTLTYVFFFLVLSAVVLRDISDFLSISVLLKTPVWFIDVTFIGVIIYGVFLGIETIARTGEILFGWGLLVICITAVALLNQFDIHNFQPFLYEGLVRPLKGIYPILGLPIGEFVFITTIFPLVKKQDRDKLRKSLKLFIALLTIMSVTIIALAIGVMGADETSRSPFAVYDLAKNINIEEIIVRIEILVAMVWIATIFMKLVLCVYALTVITGQMLRLSTYRPLIVPFSFVIVPMSILSFRNVAHARFFSMEIWPLYSLLQGVVLPLLLLIIAVITGKRDFSDGRFLEREVRRGRNSVVKTKEGAVDLREPEESPA